MMFEAGKPVLCEKPLTCCAADTRALIKAAKEKGIFLMEVNSYRLKTCNITKRSLSLLSGIGCLVKVFSCHG